MFLRNQCNNLTTFNVNPIMVINYKKQCHVNFFNKVILLLDVAVIVGTTTKYTCPFSIFWTFKYFQLDIFIKFSCRYFVKELRFLKLTSELDVAFI